MSVQGLKNVERAIKQHQKLAVRRLRKGLYRGGLFLMRESKKIVPIDEGFLKASGHTRMEGGGLSSAVVVAYGMDYAIYVHENLEKRHKPGKQAKFLEQPLREKRTELKRVILEGMEEVL